MVLLLGRKLSGIKEERKEWQLEENYFLHFCSTSNRLWNVPMISSARDFDAVEAPSYSSTLSSQVAARPNFPEVSSLGVEGFA
jgi:hypothetical protein